MILIFIIKLSDLPPRLKDRRTWTTQEVEKDHLDCQVTSQGMSELDQLAPTLEWVDLFFDGNSPKIHTELFTS